jgi:disulfide bond formation protein DsbB
MDDALRRKLDRIEYLLAGNGVLLAGLLAAESRLAAILLGVVAAVALAIGAAIASTRR